jgi:hypothetical protein
VPRFSIVTTCKGRLHHLKQSLPRFLEQRDSARGSAGAWSMEAKRRLHIEINLKLTGAETSGE